MTEKQIEDVRIAIVKMNPKNNGCPFLDVSDEMAPLCTLDCKAPYCKKCKKGIFRKEAIERMARVLHSFNTIPTTEEQWKNEVIDNVKGLYRAQAEAALDALLKSPL